MPCFAGILKPHALGTVLIISSATLQAQYLHLPPAKSAASNSQIDHLDVISVRSSDCSYVSTCMYGNAFANRHWISLQVWEQAGQ